MYAQVSKLFQNQEDLLSEFGQFLPDCTAQFGGVSHSLYIVCLSVCMSVCLFSVYVGVYCVYVSLLVFNVS